MKTIFEQIQEKLNFVLGEPRYQHSEEDFYCGICKAIEIVEDVELKYQDKESNRIADSCSECSRREFYQQGYEDGYKDGLNADKWISCEKELPKEKGLYLVTRESEEVNCDFFETFSNTAHFNEYGDYHEINDKVIAWQPRPKPYKTK